MILALASVAFAAPELEFELDPPEPLQLLPSSVAVADLAPVLDPAAVPVWPDMRRFHRHRDATIVGLAAGTVGGILLAAALPDRGRLLPLDVGCFRGFACGIPLQR